jgi:phosphoribosylformylglycinamidine (FGAM) synthase-like amidotransferase family enzyme
MAALLPAASVHSENLSCADSDIKPPLVSLTASLMTFGFDPALMEADPYGGAKAAVKEALAKFACLGGDYRKARLSMQEYFERMEGPESWGKPAAALLGALEAQLALKVPAIGGKDSMSGSYRDPANGIDVAVPPTLVVFAAGTADAASIRSGALSGRPGNPIILLYGNSAGPQNTSLETSEWAVFKANMKGLAALTERGLVKAAHPVGPGGVAAALALMAFGNMTGVEVNAACLDLVNEKTYPGAILAELDGEALHTKFDGGKEALAVKLQAACDNFIGCGVVWKEAALTIPEPVFRITGSTAESAELPLTELRRAFEAALAHVYPQTAEEEAQRDVVFQCDRTAGVSRKTIAKKILETPPVEIKIPVSGIDHDVYKAYSERIPGWRKKSIDWAVTKIPNCVQLTDGNVFFTRSSFRNALAHGKGKLKILTIPYLVELLQGGILFHTETAQNFTFYNYAHPILFDKSEHIAIIVVKEDNTGKKFYDNEFIVKKSTDGLDRSLGRLNDQQDTSAHPSIGSILRNILFVKNTLSSPSSILNHSRPLAVLPVFPGTNCEWDMERAFREAGARTRLVVFRNRSPADIADSIAELAAAIAGAQILALSGGFSAGDEPDGSGKFIANVLRAPAVAGAVQEFLEKREGLVLGICNGFQALIKMGLVPYGRYVDTAEHSPTLTFNRIGRHVSRMVRTVVMPSASPWLALEEPGTVHILPVSHGEGRLVIRRAEAETLFKAEQVPFCYSDSEGRPTLAEPDNPNGSDHAIEALTSPDGRILGKMGHSERRGQFVHVNIPGNKIQRIFEAGVRYFS